MKFSTSEVYTKSWADLFSLLSVKYTLTPVLNTAQTEIYQLFKNESLCKTPNRVIHGILGCCAV
jgi:hypothetical protein